MKTHKHIGTYGLILNCDNIVLIKKVGGPYDGKLDLPGGTTQFGETLEQALIRELKEEVGINVTKYELFDADSVTVDWDYKNELIKVHHIGIFYKIISYENEIKSDIIIDSKNDDSMGASFYNIKELTKSMLSNIAILEIEKLGYELKE